jgi:hypothetical protein
VHCGHAGDSLREQAAYRKWIDRFAEGVPDNPVIVFLEQDALITTPCLTSRGLRARLAELRYAAQTLDALPHTVLYIDGGAADALPPARTASLLRRAGLNHVNGFFLNATHWQRSPLQPRSTRTRYPSHYQHQFPTRRRIHVDRRRREIGRPVRDEQTPDRRL